MPTAAEQKPERFGRLLGALDSDPERARFLYEELQQKLINVFRGGDCSGNHVEALVQETLGKVEDKLSSGGRFRISRRTPRMSRNPCLRQRSKTGTNSCGPSFTTIKLRRKDFIGKYGKA